MAVKVISKGGKVTFFGKAIKADTKIAVNDNLTHEDDFNGLYWNQKNPNNLLIEPPYNPLTLAQLVTRNNSLSQCISAMEVNIDGTGFTIEQETEEKKGTDKDWESLDNFFKEPYPGISFLTMRRELRWDLEATGNAYLEVLKNLDGEIVFLRRVDSTTVRLVLLDAAIQIEQEVTRGNEKFSAKIWVRERRFAQKVGQKVFYFKEFGASRQLNRDTGEWVKDGVVVPAEQLASEIIHLTCEKDVRTAYGVPRWINQLPSILGSRKAEEFNLEFFDNGGVPPAAIFIQGGALAADIKDQLNGYFGGGAKGKHRVAVVEVQSTSGSIDSPGNVQVKTERFGDSRTSDAMFQTYDKNCEEHVRVGFRLPPLFLGRAQDYNFATAMTAYMVTEAQVFGPERKEFDEMITTKLIKSFGIQGWVFKSKPLTLKDVQTQITALGLVKSMIKGEQLVETINAITGLSLTYDEASDTINREITAGVYGQPPDPNAPPGKKPAPGAKPAVPAKPTGAAKPPAGNPRSGQLVAKSETPEDVVQLVAHWCGAMGLEGESALTEDEKEEVLKLVRELDSGQMALFNAILAQRSFVMTAKDTDGLGAIAGSCAHVMTGQG